jgi:chromosome segregation ATPase
MVDNSASLRIARRRDSKTKRARAASTLQAMVETGEPISFPAVARRAGVSVSLLYADHDLAGRLADARNRQRQAGSDRAWRLPTRALVTEQSLRTELANAKEQVLRFTDEVTLLRDRLARQLGAEADLARGRIANPLLEQLEERAAELETDNAGLRRNVVDLENETRELTETLDAARTMNRELMSELNSSTPRSTDIPRSRSVRLDSAPELRHPPGV